MQIMISDSLFMAFVFFFFFRLDGPIDKEQLATDVEHCFSYYNRKTSRY